MKLDVEFSRCTALLYVPRGFGIRELYYNMYRERGKLEMHPGEESSLKHLDKGGPILYFTKSCLHSSVYR